MDGRRWSVVGRPAREPGAATSPSERLYARLLGLYPARYRREYGPLMRQLFRDLLRDTRDQRRGWAVAGLWLRVVAELGVTASREHVAEIERRIMETNAKSGGAFTNASARGLLLASLVIAGGLLAKIAITEFLGGSIALATGIAVALNLAAAVIMERAVRSGGIVLLGMTLLVGATLLPVLWVADPEAWLRENPVNGFIVILVSAWNARQLRWPILAASSIMGAALIAISFF